MSRREIGILVLAVMLIGAIVPALLIPSLADAAGGPAPGWNVYTPNHPNACAPLPYDCYVVWIDPPDPP